MSKKIVIIGAGPGGYVCAIRAAQLGFDTTIIEKGNLGGTCLNEGCIPSKFLLELAKNLNSIKSLDFYGIDVEKPEVNLKKLNKRKSIIIKKLSSGVNYLLEKNKVKIIKGEARFKDDKAVIVNDEVIPFDYAIISSGASFKNTIDDKRVISHKQALELKEIPKSITVIGANAIGVEFAYIYNSLGAKVSILDENNLLSEFKDEEVSNTVKSMLTKSKINVSCGCEIDLSSIDSDVILDVRNRCSNIDNLRLENTNITCLDGFISVDKDFETTSKSIFAIGDVNGIDLWAHSASEQGLYILDKISGKQRKYQSNTIPKNIYISPEISVIGLSEEEAKSKGIDVDVSRFSLASNGMSMILKDDKGYIKVIVGKKYKEVLGAQIIGNRATDIISVIGLAIRLEATVDEMIDMVYSHPSIVEGIKESFLGVDNIAIHM